VGDEADQDPGELFDLNKLHATLDQDLEQKVRFVMAERKRSKHGKAWNPEKAEDDDSDDDSADNESSEESGKKILE
jgi:hypothetical protein